MTKSKTKKAAGKEKIRLENAVGENVYQAWVAMLKKLVPYGRTHRLSVLVASMLQYAIQQNVKKGKSVIELLEATQEDRGEGEASSEIRKMLEQLFKDAKVKFKRRSSQGHGYSIIDDAIEEFVAWDNMPWER